VNEQTHGGHCRLSSFDSDFDLTKVGDTVNVVYLNTTPYKSIVGDDPRAGLKESGAFFMLWLVATLIGAWLSALFPRKGMT